MLFTSHIFLFIFLPLTIILFYFIRNKFNTNFSILFLLISSIIFYLWWYPIYIILLLSSILFNYQIGKKLYIKKSIKILIFGILCNVFVIGYFKYSLFFIETFYSKYHNWSHFEQIILPLGISFFTFQQIGFLIDTYKGKTSEKSFISYSIFVSFFPQLIAGPIVKHKDISDQITKKKFGKFKWSWLYLGLCLFTIGLSKKVFLADNFAPFSNSIFNGVSNGVSTEFFEAWLGTIAYSLQLYFDFSGYSDMAIGLGFMFGIRLPINFISPYKSTGAIEFWNRWHISLSSWLRDYVFNPLEIFSQRRLIRQNEFIKHSATYLNIIITFLISGLWHGAGWTFILWGLFHGILIVINNFWVTLSKIIKIGLTIPKPISILLLYIFIVFAWVPFRAENLDTTYKIWKTMLGLNGISLPRFFGDLPLFLEKLGFKTEGIHSGLLVDFNVLSLWCIFGMLIVWFGPSSIKIFLNTNYKKNIDTNLIINQISKRKLISKTFSIFIGIILFIAFLYTNSNIEFLYFQF
ncbi:MAG: Peptidoglycan O-acetyltransferase [Alphaproteobacteria bacterium MarineAlpha2_Bin1]|nr:MAG: Peptidoglycan O-acetyltransferase [Alphaproteobacteria bacterium MarineAlpha2_Bin1]